jgi:exonuclease III
MRGGTARNTSLTQKWSYVSQTMYRCRIVILALQETHLDLDRTERIQECFSKNLEIITSEDLNDPTGRAGVAFVINKTLLDLRELSTHKLLLGQALMLKIKWLEACETSLLNVYIPTNQAKQEPFWNEVNTTRRGKHLAHLEIVLGDFNIMEDKIDRVPAHADNKTAAKALRNIRQSWEIQDMWRHAYPNE